MFQNEHQISKLFSRTKKIANDFRKASGAGFDCCAGVIDGLLIWVHKPSQKCCCRAGCQDGKFFCGRKKKFGLNFQRVLYCCGQFLDISIKFPASTSDLFAFEGMSLFDRLQNGLLDKGLLLFGNNAYLNLIYMATPYLSADTNKNTYNFFHSQL